MPEYTQLPDDRALSAMRQLRPHEDQSLPDSDGGTPRAAGSGPVEHLELLAHATAALLGESLDYRATLSKLARLAVPRIADWCAVDVQEEGQPTLTRVVVVHTEPEKENLARLVHERYPMDPDAQYGPEHVLRTRRSQLVQQIPGELVDQAAADPEHRSILRSLNLCSAMIVPLVARGRALGVITFVSSESGRVYTDEDLELAEGLAGRAALALDNARLFGEVQDAERRMRSLVQDLECVVWDADPHTLTFSFVSDHAEALLGYPLARWTEPGFRELVLDPLDRDALMAEMREAIKQGRDYELEYRVHKADGSTAWLRDIVHVVTDESGQTRRVRGVTIDITQRKSDEGRKEALRRVAGVLADANTVEQAAHQLLRAIGDTLDWDLGEFWIMDERSRSIARLSVWSAPGFSAPKFIEACSDIGSEVRRGLPGRILGGARPAWIRDISGDESFPRRDEAAEENIRSAFGLPIVLRRDVLGALTFYSTKRREPDLDLLQTSATVGSQIGQFVERKRLENILRFHAALLGLQSEASLDGIIVVSPSGNLLYHNQRFLELAGLTESALARIESDAILRTLDELIVKPKDLLERALELQESPDLVGRDEVTLRDGRVLDAWSAPLRDDDENYMGRAWYLRDITNRKRSEELLREAKQRFEFLAGASSLLATTQDFETVVEHSAELVVKALADLCLVHTRDRLGGLGLLVAAGATRPASRARRVFERAGASSDLVVETVERGASRLIDLEDASTPAELRALGYRSAMVLPLRERGGRVMGALTALRAEPYTASDLDLAVAFAARASLAADNARLYQDRAYVARTLQESLLPPVLPPIPGTEVVARYLAAGEGNEVGGDFYDLFPTEGDGWGIVIGDVCGKGAEAASLTALARYTIRAVGLHTRRPSRILGPLNDAILNQRSDRRFCTVAYARLVSLDRAFRVSVCLGGHPPPIILRRAGTVERFGQRGTVLGLFPDPTLTDRHTDLHPGDAIVFYTDGVTDARGPDGVFGEEGLIEVLRGCAGGDATEMVAAVERAALEHQHGDPKDDIALIVVRVDPRLD